MKVCEAAAQNSGFKSLQLGATLPGVPLYEVMGYKAIENIDQPMPDGVMLPLVKMFKAL
jgi:hypothetical protein